MNLEPVQKPGKSRQDYGTPWPFVRACGLRFGMPEWDLAASVENRKATNYFAEGHDSLKQDWTRLDGVLWLNPPFRNIEPWARKCALTSKRRRGFILLLTPASIGTEWFADHVNGKAMVLGLRPRLVFEGETDAYPKDLSLSVFGYGLHGFDTWCWNETETENGPAAGGDHG